LREHISGTLRWPAEVNPALSEGVCRMITKMMAKNPADRYQEPKELLYDLDMLTEGAEPKVDDAVLRNSSVAIALEPRAVRPRPASSRRLPRARERIERRRRRGEERAEAPVRQGMSSGTKQAIVAGASAVAAILIGALLLGGGRKRVEPRKRGRGGGAPRPPAPAGGGAPSRVAARLSSPKSGTDGDSVARPGPSAVPRKARSSSEAAAEYLRKAEKHERESPHDAEGAMVLYRMVTIYHAGTPEAAKAEARLARFEGLLRKPIVVTPGSGLETTEPGGTATFEVKLGAAPAEAVRVSLTSSDETEGTIEGAAGGPPAVLTLTFTPADWETPKRVVVTGRDDPVGDGSPCYTIGLVTSSADPDYDKRAKRLSVTNIGDEAPPPQRKILREWWLPAVGADSAVLTRNNPPAPTGSAHIASLDGPQNWKDNYNSRIRGHIQPPVGGEYVFYLSCDDNGQLWLSTDHDPANMAKIAEVNEWRHYGWSNAVASRPVALQAGQRYYVEVVHKEGGSGDHVRVGWRRPDGVSEKPIPGSCLSPWYDGPQAPRIASTARAEAYAGVPYFYTVAVTGDPPPRIRVSEDAPWLVFDGIRKLTGAPGAGDVGAAATVTVTAANGVAPDATQQFKIAVKQVDPGLVGWWSFEGDAGTVAHDSSGRGNHGTIHGATWTEGRIGGALAFDGKSYVDIDSGVTELGGDDYTIAAWVMTDTNGGTILSKSNNDNRWERCEKKLYISKSGGPNQKPVGSVVWVGNAADWISGSQTVNDDEWHHVAVTWDSVARKGMAYVDGRAGLTRSNFNGLQDKPGDKIRTGWSPGGEGAVNFTGLIDEVRIYSRALSAEEIAKLVGPMPPFISSFAPAAAGAGFEYTYTIEASGNPAPRITVTGLPGWLGFDGKDTVSGTPGRELLGSSTAAITVTATNGLHPDATQVVRVEVRAVDLARGLVGHWKFDEGEGTVARDSSGRGNDGAVKGGARRVEGRIGGALEFDGIDDYVDCGNNASLAVSAAITMTLWVNRRGRGGDQRIIYHGGGWGDDGYCLGYNNNRVKAELQNTGTGKKTEWGSGVAAPPDNEWHHLAFMWDDADDTMSLYIDGVDTGARSRFPGPMGSPTRNMTVGSKGGGHHFKGLVDDVRIYDRALSAVEIAALAASK
ncbi:MAG: LamG-like jellyroll fold domain-containing protein, partial [Planctomycetota bacterium]